MTITRYGLVDRDNNERGDYDTYDDAVEDAKELGGYAVVEYQFEFADSELVWTPDGSTRWPPKDEEDEDE